MNFNLKKGFAFSVLLLFAFSFFVPFVMANNHTGGVGGQSGGATPTSAAGAVLGPIGDMFANWGEGQLSVNIAKYLLWAVLALLLYSILTNIPSLKEDSKSFIRWIIAVIASFLAIAYITPQEVYAIMVSYTGMGFVLGGFLPILILLFFTWQLASKTHGGAQEALMKLITWFMWLGYTIFAVLKIFVPPTNLGYEVNPSDVWVSWIFVAVGVFMLIFNRYIWGIVGKAVRKAEVDAYRNASRKQGSKMAADARQVDQVNNELGDAEGR